MSVFVQVGAGAGDQDARAKFRDGFTEYVKSLDPASVQKIILIEPNPLNIDALRECWKNHPQAQIIQAGIRPSTQLATTLTFYYAKEDHPHYQVFSMVENHVRKHYKNGTIQSIDVETLTIIELLDSLSVHQPIDLLALDIEGIDAEVILDIDWCAFPCKRVSFEFTHMGSMESLVQATLNNAGYFCIGWGLDVNRLDWMYGRPSTWRETILFRKQWFWFWLRVRLGRRLKTYRRNFKKQFVRLFG